MSSSRGAARTTENRGKIVARRRARRRPPRWLVGALLATGALGSLALLSCGGRRRSDRPTPTLASSPEAETEIVAIREEWSDLAHRSREALRLRLQRYLTKYPDDGAVPLVHVYLAFLALDDGDLTKADTHLAPLAGLAPGATADFAAVARAQILRRRGRAPEAFEILRPLAGKMVDPDARARFQEEISLDAIAAHRDYEAVAYMDAWLRTGDDSERSRAREVIPAALAKISPEVLEGSLRAMRESGGYSTEMQRLVAQQLAVVAVDRGDARLAEWLVDPDAGAPVLTGDAGIRVSELATHQRGVTLVRGRSVGLVLPTRSTTSRDIAVDVARGAAWALDLPRRLDSEGDGTRLLTRDDTGRPDDVGAVLEDAASDGAVVLIAGFDPRSADVAVRWAEASGVPVLVLAAPRTQTPSRWAFVLGESEENQVNALASALVARHETKVAPVAARAEQIALAKAFATRKSLTPFQPVGCELDVQRIEGTRFPIVSWERAGFRTWLVAGPEQCARDLLREVGSERGGLVALTLDASSNLDDDLSTHVIATSAGVLPVLGGEKSATRDRADGGAPSAKGAAHGRAPLDPDVQRFIDAFGTPPTWRTALGRDAALFARRALTKIPLTDTNDPKEVAWRREQVRSALETLRGERLWTTEAPGIDPSTHTLPRTIRVLEVSRGTAR